MYFVFFLILQILVLINADLMSECKQIRKNACIFVPKKFITEFESKQNADKLMTIDFLKQATEDDVSKRLKTQTTQSGQRLIEFFNAYSVAFLEGVFMDCNGSKYISQEILDKLDTCGTNVLAGVETAINQFIDNLAGDKQLTVLVKTKMNECGNSINQTDIVGPVTVNSNYRISKDEIITFREWLSIKQVDNCVISNDDIVFLDTSTLFVELAMVVYKTDRWKHTLETSISDPVVKCMYGVVEGIINKDCKRFIKNN